MSRDWSRRNSQYAPVQLRLADAAGPGARRRADPRSPPGTAPLRRLASDADPGARRARRPRHGPLAPRLAIGDSSGVRVRLATSGLLVNLALGTACGGDLPISERIASTRVLALRSDVISPLFPETDPDLGPRCEALPFEQVRLTPWVVTPEGPLDLTDRDNFDPVWIACPLAPGRGLFGCIKEAFPLALADIPTCPPPALMGLGGGGLDALSETGGPCILPDDGTPDGVQEFTVPLAGNLLLGGDLEVTMISRSPGSPTTAECAEPFLADESDLPNDCLYAVQRIAVGPTERLLTLAGMFGVQLPPELGEVPDPEDIPDGDRNPRIQDFQVFLIHPDADDEDLGPQPRGAVIQASPGDTLKVVTNAPEGDLQQYLVPINGGAGGSETRDEAYDGSWFRTWGSLLANGSDDPMSMDDWTMERGAQDETETAPNGRATLYYVLRDGRLGVDWWWISVELPPE
jgi:hypothetical protein